MIDWDVTDHGLQAVDANGVALDVAAPDWQSAENDVKLDVPVDAVVRGSTSAVSVPGPHARLQDLETGDVVPISRSGTRRRVAGSHLLSIDGPVTVAVAFDAPADVALDGGTVEVSFSSRAPVAVGARHDAAGPATTVTVPETKAGVAAAITHAASAHRSLGPERSHPALRGHPPAVEFGEALDVPEAIAAATPDVGIDVSVPASLQSLFLVAPLAFYLGATVTIEEGVDPHVAVPGRGYRFDLGPDLRETAPDTLARAFWFDCLVREATVGTGDPPAELDLLSAVGLDPHRVAAAEPDERVVRYLEAPYDRVRDSMPEWHLAMYVEPSTRNAATLPSLLDRLCVVYPPETRDLDARDLVQRSLDDFYRQPAGPTPTVEMVQPRLRRGRLHGWLAEGTPIDVFKAVPAAYENHRNHQCRDDGEASVVVVLNDHDMAGEHDAVAEIYRERADAAGLEVTLREGLTVDELAAVLQEPHDFLHYIGHCEVDGLLCADGNLAVADLPSTAIRTFFLNACGSYREGLDLVERGAVAGAVTFRKVLDEQAATVGTAFARLLAHGFPIETAMRLARRRIMMGKDYAVVGDGMQRLPVAGDRRPEVAYVETLDSGDLEVAWNAHGDGSHGGVHHVDVPEAGPPRLCGNPIEFTVAPGPLASLLAAGDVPVILDGEFRWSDDVAAALD